MRAGCQRADNALNVLTVVTTSVHTAAVSYRPRTVPPRSDWGRFLVRMRQERDWSAVQAHEALHEGLGLKLKSKASYTAIEDGRDLRPSEERYLREFFGGGPTDVDRDPHTAGGDDTPPPAAYLKRIDDLVGLVSQLVEQNAALMAAAGISLPVTPLEKAGVYAAAGEVEPESPTPSTPRSLDHPASGGGPRTRSRASASTGARP